MVKALAHNAQLDAVDRLAERLAIRRGRDLALAGIEAVFAGEHFEQHGDVAHATRHRADMIESWINTHHARVRHEAVGRLVTDDARPRRGNPDRAALVGADSQMDIV